MQEPASASPSSFAPSPPHPLPVGLCLGNLGPSILHSSKRGFAGANFLKFESQGASGWEEEDGRRDFDSFDWQCRPFGQQKKNPLFVGSPPAEAGVSLRENELSASYSPPPNSNLKLRNRERWLRKISNVCTLTISCPAPDGIVFHSGATQMVPQSGLKSFTLPPPVPSGRCWLLDTCRFKFFFLNTASPGRVATNVHKGAAQTPIEAKSRKYVLSP